MNREQVVAKLSSVKAQAFIDQVAGYLKNIPHLPAYLSEIFFNLTPWMVAISGVLTGINGLQYILNALGLTTVNLPFLVSPTYWLLIGIQHLVSSYLAFMAFPLLRAQMKAGWTLLFWNVMTGVFATVVTILFVPRGTILSLLGIILGLYIVFELRPFFTKPYSELENSADASKKTSTTTSKKKKTS